MLRRTRKDVGRELPPVNKLIYEVDTDDEEVHKVEALAVQLAMATRQGNFMERGQAAREFDMRLRHVTGVSKAKAVAAWIKMIAETGEKVVLAGWHRDVYDIWMHELKHYNPVMYTGTESAAEKERSKEAFVNGDSQVFIISLRSGIGLDGLQYVCKTVVIGELDYSPKVHDQLITRVDRDGNEGQTTAIFLVSTWGSDPPIIDLLGLKSSQSQGIMDPLTAVQAQHSDESRIKYMVDQILRKKELVQL